MPTKTTVVRTAASEASTLNVKVRCGADVRRVPMDVAGLDLEGLMGRLTVMFNLDGLNHNGSFRIKYQDNEGDLISVTDDEELQAAFTLAEGWDARTPFRMEIFKCPSSPHNRGFAKPRPLNLPVVHIEAVDEPTVQQAKFVQPQGQDQDQDQDQDGKDERQYQEPDGRPRGRHGRHGRYGGCHRGQGWRDHRRGKWNGHGHGSSPPWMEGRKSRFISDVTVPDGTVVAPGTKVCKIWKLSNCGEQDWPSGTTLLHVGGDSVLERPQEPIVVHPAVASGEVDVAADLIAPEEPGRYISYFRLCGPRGMRFGQRIWVMLIVADDESEVSESEVSEDQSAEQEPLVQKQKQKQKQKQLRQAAKRERMIAKQAAKAQKLAAKSEQLVARAAKIKASQQGGKHKDPAALAMIEEKIRHIETQASNLANQAAAIQASLGTVVELSPEDAAAVGQLTQDQQAIVTAAGLTSAQLQAVCNAVAAQQHLGIICDATRQQPIVGVRYTKPSNGDTYDLCQAAFDKLQPEEQEEFEAVPTPDINILIRNVLAVEEAVPPQIMFEPEPEPQPPSVVDDDGKGVDSGSEFELVDGDASSEEKTD